MADEFHKYFILEAILYFQGVLNEVGTIFDMISRLSVKGEKYG